MRNKENRKQKLTRQSDNKGGTEILFGWLMKCAVILLLVSLDSIAYSDPNDLIRVSQIIANEFDPASLLATDSTQDDDEEEPALFDIQVPKHVDLTNIYNLQPTDVLAKNFASTINESPSQIKPTYDNTTSGQLEKQLRKSQISAPVRPQPESKTDELRQLIEQIRSIKIEPGSTNPAEPKQSQQQPADTAPTSALQPITTKTSAESTTPQGTIGLNTETTAGSISEQTFQKVEDLLKDANHIANPLELAEILYQSGRPVPAGLCYKKALDSIAANDPNLANERAWILFQIGNCLKDYDPNTARESYAELIRTYPESPWTEIARARHGLIDWYQADKPDELIRQLNRPKP